MKEAIKKNKKIIIIAIAIIVLLLIGIAFAYLTTTIFGEKEYIVRAGSLGLILEEDNELTLEKIIPMEDEEGMTLTGFDFRLINRGKIDTDYTIYLDDIPLEEGETRMPDSAIRYSLTRDNVVGNADDLTNMGTNPNRVVDTGTIEPDQTINYTLRIWIDYDATTEEASGKTFKGKLRVEASQHVIPETTKKILEDNEIQVEKTNMFNYASNGNYLDMSSGPQNNPEYVTNGLYSIEDEDGTSYYFRGNVNNNNVQFGEYTSDYYVYQNGSNYYQSESSCTEAGNSSCTQVKLASAGDKMYWKIIRINGDGSLRLIYNGTNPNSISSNPSSLGETYAVGYTPYNLESNDPKYAGYTYDNGVDSFIKKEVDTWYKNTLGSSSYDSKVLGGRFCSDSSGYKKDTDYGFPSMNYNVFASYDRLGQSATGYTKENSPTLKCPVTSESYGGSYRLKAGLITADELVIAGENPGVNTDSYLNPGDSEMYYWSMTPAAFNIGYANGWYEYDGLNRYRVNDDYAVRPVINVTTENGFTSGDGTVENIYVIS